MREGDTFVVGGATFTVQRALGAQRYVVSDPDGELGVIEGPDEHGRYSVLNPIVPANAFVAFTREPLGGCA